MASSSSSVPDLPEEETQALLFCFLKNAKKNINTKRKTASDLKTWYKWCKLIKEERLIEDIPVELDRLLGHFFAY